ncbi:unnamed protein product [Prorocentrum cordatum]|uniref:Nuclear pore complex protein n=1 Tax=Prorocentrum cordatum TaxID=2364126 RepID=A0ABN9X9G4_9DINO|nr:unnamed protein product [Polarella glacialis]
MPDAASKYAAALHEQEDRPVKVCKEAGRKCVRCISQQPVLSLEWLALVDHLLQLTRLMQLEARMPADTKVADVQGRNSESVGTLWDQEVHENAIRILVEEAKVTLCLRMIHDYKKWHYDVTNRQADLMQGVISCGWDERQLRQKCDQYEECLGILLMRAFQHRETLQLIDLPLLIEHVALVLDPVLRVQADVDLLASGMLVRQEFIVLYYFASLMKHAEALNNTELLARTKDHQLLRLVIRHCVSWGAHYDATLAMAVAEGLACLADNEAWFKKQNICARRGRAPQVQR